MEAMKKWEKKPNLVIFDNWKHKYFSAVFENRNTIKNATKPVIIKSMIVFDFKNTFKQQFKGYWLNYGFKIILFLEWLV